MLFLLHFCSAELQTSLVRNCWCELFVGALRSQKQMKQVEITHGNGIVTRYAHLSKWNVKKGQRVTRGYVIGYVGNTGRSTGSHLHYEVYKDGKAVNPMRYVFQESGGFWWGVPEEMLNLFRLIDGRFG